MAEGNTRDRILDAALDLFSENGYEATSLRQVAERVGITKASLYYHFPSKKEMLRALVERISGGAEGFYQQLVEHGLDIASWSLLVDNLIEEVIQRRALFVMIDRNRTAFEALSREEDMFGEMNKRQEQLTSMLSDPAVPLVYRVRFACAIGAVLGSVATSARAFADVAPSELARLVREAARDLLAPLPTHLVLG
jgi:AcrR family transcriptional regulator